LSSRTLILKAAKQRNVALYMLQKFQYLSNQIPKPIKKIIPKLLKSQIKSIIKKQTFSKVLNEIDVDIVFSCKKKISKAFGIVHWNAVDFLLLNIEQLEKLHPESKIYIFDNRSAESQLRLLNNKLKEYENITLISNKNDYSNSLINHTIGLQYLINHSANQNDDVIVFLDQDCIVNIKLDSLISKLNANNLLIGARDVVEIPKDYGLIKKRMLRNYPGKVHASFMIMQPAKICEMLGKRSLFDRKTFEPYHGISKKLNNKIIFLDTKVHDEIPLLTSYSYENKIYAWHSWYSSRTTRMNENYILDGISVRELKKIRRQSYEFMAQIVGKKLLNT